MLICWCVDVLMCLCVDVFILFSVAERSRSIIFHFIVVFEKYPSRRRKVIIKLTVPYTPEEGEQKASGNADADQEKKDDCAHFSELWIVMLAASYQLSAFRGVWVGVWVVFIGWCVYRLMCLWVDVFIGWYVYLLIHFRLLRVVEA